MSTTVTLQADGQSHALSAADIAGGWQLQLAPGLSPADLQWVWQSDATAESGHYSLQLSQGRGELVLPSQVMTASPGTSAYPLLRPDTIDGLQALIAGDGQDITAAVLAALHTQVQQRQPAPIGTVGDDLITLGAWVPSSIYGPAPGAWGGEGNDTIVALAREPMVEGLYGLIPTRVDSGAGDDTLILHAGWGSLQLDTSTGHDTIRLADLNRGDVHISRRNTGFTLAHDTRQGVNGYQLGGLDQVTFGLSDLTGGADIQVQFADGTALALQDLMALPNDADLPAPPTGQTLTATAPNETLVGGAGDDTLTGKLGGDVLDGGPGNDVLQGGNGSVIRWSGQSGFDRASFEPGSGTLLLDSPDVIVTGAEQDLPVHKYNNSALPVVGYQVSGQIYLHAPASQGGGTLLWTYGAPLFTASYFPSEVYSNQAVVVRFADGSAPWTLGDILQRAGHPLLPTHDLKLGSEANDTLIGDQIQGGAGDDLLTLNPIDATPAAAIYGLGDGQDTLIGSKANNDTLRLGAGITPDRVVLTERPSLTGVYSTSRVGFHLDLNGRLGGVDMSLIERIAFDDGVVWSAADIDAQARAHNTYVSTGGVVNFGGADFGHVVVGATGNDVIYGSDFDDSITGGGGINELDGEGGNDTLVSGGAQDTLDGGNGNDLLQGSGTLIGGQGRDTIQGRGVVNINAVWGQDLVQLAGDAQATVWALEDATIQVAAGAVGSAGSLTVQAANVLGDLYLQPVVAADGQAALQLRQRYVAMPLATIEGAKAFQVQFLNDNLTVSSGQLPLAKAGVVHEFSGGAGNDLLAAATGDGIGSLLDGGVGNDTLNGGAQADSLVGGLGDDLLDGGAGDDTLWGGERDTLRGGAGNDLLIEVQGQGSSLDGGDGNDTLRAIEGQVTLKGGAGVDSYELRRQDLIASDVHVQAGSEDAGINIGFWRLNFNASGTVLDDGSLVLSLVDDSWEPTQPGPNTLTIEQAASVSQLVIRDTYGGLPSVMGTVGDFLEQATHTAILGPANDSVTGGVQRDSLDGGAGNDTLDGGAGNDTLLGAAGNDNLLGGDGDDWLQGGTGNDVLDGGAGNNTLVFNPGDGQDTVRATQWDQLVVHGYTAADLQVSSSGALVGNTLLVSLSHAAGQTLTLQVTSAYAGAGPAMWFDDGSVSTWADLLAIAPPNLTLTGTAGKDTLQGQAGNDTLTGLAGNDSLNGGAGDDSLSGGLGADTLVGGLGNDTLVGDKGNDTYLFARGDGQDTIVDKDSTWFNSDVLKISNAKSNQLWFTRSGNNLNIAIIGTADKVTIQDWYLSSANRMEKITALGDNKTLNLSKLSGLVSAMAGFTNQAMAGTDLPAGTSATLSKLITSSWTPA